MNQNHRGPRVGDQVKVELPGEVIEIEVRDGVSGVVVALDQNAGAVWVPLDRAVLQAWGHVKR